MVSSSSENTGRLPKLKNQHSLVLQSVLSLEWFKTCEFHLFLVDHDGWLISLVGRSGGLFLVGLAIDSSSQESSDLFECLNTCLFGTSNTSLVFREVLFGHDVL